MVTFHRSLFPPGVTTPWITLARRQSAVPWGWGWELDRVPSLTADVYPGRPIPADHDRRPDPSPVLLPFPAHRQGAMVGAMATQDAPGHAIHAGDEPHHSDKSRHPRTRGKDGIKNDQTNKTPGSMRTDQGHPANRKSTGTFLRIPGRNPGASFLGTAKRKVEG